MLWRLYLWEHLLQALDHVIYTARSQVGSDARRPPIGPLRALPVTKPSELPGLLHGMPEVENFASSFKHRGSPPDPLGAIAHDDDDGVLVDQKAREPQKSEKSEALPIIRKEMEAIQDKSDCVFFLIDSLSENERTIPGLIAKIDSLFADSAACCRLSTVHKAKGLEAPRVFWLNSSQCPAKWARSEAALEQEKNICFVADTRAKVETIYIEMPRSSQR